MKNPWSFRLLALGAGALVCIVALSAVAAGPTSSVTPRIPGEQVQSPEVLLAALVGIDVELCPIQAEPGEVTAAAGCATVAAPVGDPLCADGGTKCANQGAKCTRSSGACGHCHDVVVGDATGEHCRGCTCL